jgi:hypothetical protein
VAGIPVAAVRIDLEISYHLEKQVLKKMVGLKVAAVLSLEEIIPRSLEFAAVETDDSIRTQVLNTDDEARYQLRGPLQDDGSRSTLNTRTAVVF